jgi:hypothetical protein
LLIDPEPPHAASDNRLAAAAAMMVVRSVTRVMSLVFMFGPRCFV